MPTGTSPEVTRQAAPSGSVAMPGRSLQFLRITLGREQAFALRIDAVREILERAHVTPVPLMPTFISGVMNLRGAVVPVIDLGRRVGIQASAAGRRTCVVIIDAGDAEGDDRHTLGVQVDAVHEVFDLEESALEPVPKLGTRVAAGFIRNMVRVRGEATPELDLARCLGVAALTEMIASCAAA